MKITKIGRMFSRKSLRMVGLILLMALQALTSVGNAQSNLTLIVENKPLKAVLSTIESKAKVVFFYNDKDVDLSRLVKVSLTNQTLTRILDEVFKNSPNDYRIDEKQIYITKKKQIAQPKLTVKTNIITGKVMDEKGEPLIGASVMIKGENKGTITDINGKFSIDSNDRLDLVFSYIGFDAKTVAVNGKNQVQIILQESKKSLQEVVVVGYGQQKKESVVGAIAQAKGEDLIRTGITTNVGQTLTGLLPGVVTTTTTGMPGQEDPSIRIRGLSSWNGSSPLVLIDGVERSMSDIDVGQIESISVLKDASATAVFGVKGAEGVILIITKRGKEGKAKVSFSSSLTAKFVSRMPSKMDSYDSFAYQNEVLEKNNPANSNNWNWYEPQAELNKYRYPTSPNDPYFYPNVNWANEIVKPTAFTQRYDLNITGGTNFAKYFAAMSYVKDDDLLKSGLDVGLPYSPKWGFEHYNFRSNIDLNITKSTVFSVNLAGSVRIKNGYNNSVAQIWSAFYQRSPAAFPIRYPDGAFGFNINKPGDVNPVRILSGNSGLSTDYTTQLSSDFTLKQNLDFVTQGLSAQASLSYDNGLYSASSISYIDLLAKSVSKTGVVDYSPVNGGNDMDFFQRPGTLNPESFNVSSTTRRLYYKGQVNYARTFGLHEVTGLALMSREQLTSGSEFPHFREDWVGRITYGYADKYFIEANGAYNGSEKFAPAYRFAFFPSVGLGWMISNEKFMKFDWLEKLKVRYSIGKVGSDNFTSPRWSYMSGWAATSVYNTAVFGTTFINPGVGPGATYAQYTESVVGNPDLHWEVSQKQNFGLDFSLFKGIVSGSFEVFRDDRSDVFLSANARSYSTPTYFGAAPVAANIGKVLNQGFEFDVKLQNTWNGFHAWTRLNFSMAKDLVIYAEDPALRPDYQKSAGFQIGQPKLLVEQSGYTKSWDDVYGKVGFETNALRLPGGVVNVDYNGDGVINANDQIAVGYPNRPQDTYNFFLGADYKGFSFMVQFLGGYNISQYVNSYQAALDLKSPTISSALSDFWTPNNPNAVYPLGSTSATRNMLIDASFLRLKNVELSYTLSNNWLKMLRISEMKLTLSGNDLFLWSRLPDDREQNIDIWNQTQTLYPMLKRVNLGLNLTF